MFAFLNYDDVPWNNNNAEHAVHFFAKLRRFADGTFTRESLQQLLVLLSVIQTCEYRRINPLSFLLAGDTKLRGMSDFGFVRKNFPAWRSPHLRYHSPELKTGPN